MKTILKMLVLALLLIPTTSILAQTDTTKSTTPAKTDSVHTQTTAAPASTPPPKSEGSKKLFKGVRFGYQDSNFSEGDLGDLSAWYAGIFGVKSLGAGKLLSIYSGIEYFQNGASDDGDNEIILGYISIPINLRVQIGPVYAFGGFNPSFKVYDKAVSHGVDFSDQLDPNGFDIGGQVGLGIKILFLGAEIKYNEGLTSVFTDNNDKGVKSHHIQAGLCVYF